MLIVLGVAFLIALLFVALILAKPDEKQEKEEAERAPKKPSPPANDVPTTFDDGAFAKRRRFLRIPVVAARTAKRRSDAATPTITRLVSCVV
jgi:hypothetical protein